MSATRPRPLLLPAGAFLLGAALGPGTPGLAVCFAAGLAILIAGTACVTAIALEPRLGVRPGLRLALACAAVFLLGAVVTMRASHVPFDAIERRAICVDDQPVLLRGRVRGLLRRTEGPGGPGVVVDIEVESLRAGRIVLELKGKVRLFADRDAAATLDRAGLIEAWVQLRSWRGTANFGLHPWPPGPVMARVTATELIEVLDEDRPLIDRLRARIARAIDEGVGEGAMGVGSRGLARALVLGVRDELDLELQVLLREGGTAHVLAVSGLHVALVTWASAAAARRLGASRRGEAFLAWGVAWSFAALAGFGLPVQRAAVLATCFSAGRLLGRRHDSWNALSAAVLITAFISPSALFGASWWLTFGATAALLLLTRPLGALLPRPRRVATAWLRDASAVSASASLGLLPVQLHFFGNANAAAPLLNLIAVPVAGLATAASLGGALLACLSAPASRPFFATVEACAFTLGLLDGRVGVLVGAYSAAASVCWAAGLLAFAGPRDPRLRAAGLLLLIPAGGALLGSGPLPWPPGSSARVTVLDVGQGSSTLVELRPPGGPANAPPWSALIDGGGRPGSPRDVGLETVVPALRALGLRRLDLVLLSHADYDHRGGLPAVVRAFRPTTVLSAPVPLEEREALLSLRQASAWAGADFGFTAAGARLGPEGRLRVLWPPRSPSRRAPLGGNDASLVLRLLDEAGKGLMLIPGDVEAEGEAGLLEEGLPIEASVILAPHHGSRSSSGKAFLEASAFRQALVSAGESNRFGHPHPEVVQRLGRPFVTAQTGALRVSFGTWPASIEFARGGEGGRASLVGPVRACEDPPP